MFITMKLVITYSFVDVSLQIRFPQLKFDYRDPEKNFDRNKVHGLVAKLIKVESPETATALEVAAGGKVFVTVYYNNFELEFSLRCMMIALTGNCYPLLSSTMLWCKMKSLARNCFRKVT